MNKTQKDKFVYDVLKSLKNVDYIEQARTLLCKEAVDKLPECLKDYVDYLDAKYINIYGCDCISVRVRNNRYTPSDEIKAKVQDLHKSHVQQKDTLKQMELELKALIANCNSLKKAKEILPQKLHKFLISEIEKTSLSTSLVSENLIKNLEDMGFK